MTRLLLDWLRRDIATREAWQRLSLGFGGVAVGVVCYLAQSRMLGTGRSDWFDLSNPFGAFPNNLFHFIRVFILDNATSWLVVSILVFALAIYTLIAQSQRGVWRPLLVLLGYLVISVLASGGILLFATAEHISVQARFRFPLAMGLAMLALIASAGVPDFRGRMGSAIYRPMRIITKLLLLSFAYLWLMVVFLFAGVLGEQQDTLRFQAAMIFSDVFSVYRPGDNVVYDPQVLTNSIYSARVAQRFPIFANSTYVGQLNLHSDAVRDRLIELVGLPHDGLWATNDLPSACIFPAPGTAVISGPRWQVWRSDAETVCVTFPAVAQVLTNSPALQVTQLNLNDYPFDFMNRPDISTLSAEDLEIALWSLTNPSDVQWALPTAYAEGVATFTVAPPLAGWQGNLVVAHYFLEGEFLFQQIWQIQG